MRWLKTLLFVLATWIMACQLAAADAVKVTGNNSAPGEEQITIVIAPRTWFLFLEEPDRYFQNALMAFDHHRPHEAARDARRAAALLKIEAASADKIDREPLESAIFNLEVVADELAAGRIKDKEAMARAFAWAHYRMAQFHEKEAAEALKEDDSFSAGQQLQAASHHLDHGFSWAGAESGTSVASLIQGMSSIAGQMLAGADSVTAAQAEQAVRDAATALVMLEKAVPPNQSKGSSKAVPNSSK